MVEMLSNTRHKGTTIVTWKWAASQETCRWQHFIDNSFRLILPMEMSSWSHEWRTDSLKNISLTRCWNLNFLTRSDSLSDVCGYHISDRKIQSHIPFKASSGHRSWRSNKTRTLLNIDRTTKMGRLHSRYKSIADLLYILINFHRQQLPMRIL